MFAGVVYLQIPIGKAGRDIALCYDFHGDQRFTLALRLRRLRVVTLTSNRGLARFIKAQLLHEAL
jgi:hypothetical protein